jgi:hypothetical protein
MKLIIFIYRILVKNSKGRDNMRGPCIDGRIIIKLILKKKDMKLGIVVTWLRTGTSGGFCEYDMNL